MRPRRMHRRQDGFTLVELVIAVGLSGILATLLFAVLTFSITFARRGASEVEAEQLVRIALSSMVRELREAHAGADAVAVWSDALGFVSPRPEAGGRRFTTDGSGRSGWQTAIYYVHDPSRGELRRIARPWDGALALPSIREGRVVARGVKEMTITRQEDLVTITLVVSTGRRERRLETAVQVRN